jgi:hypothetical protein
MKSSSSNMASLGKKVSCPKCKTKLFTFNKDKFNCPVCKKSIEIIKNTHHGLKEGDINGNDSDDWSEMSEEEMINKVIPNQYYMEIENILNGLDKENESYGHEEEKDNDNNNENNNENNNDNGDPFNN